MRVSKSFRQAGFTLLELVVVLTILAVVTTIATRVLDQVQDQQRYEASQRGLREIETAVLGDVNERAPDGTRVMSGFVADMGRLPRTAEESAGTLSLHELWKPLGAPPYDARPAIVANGVPLGYEDPEVLVPGGWRGPYLRLPLGAEDLLDGWGNPYHSPTDPAPAQPELTGYARLRGSGDTPLIAAGQEIHLIRHLGSSGVRDDGDQDFNRDEELNFEGRYAAELKASVQVVDEDGLPVEIGTDKFTVCVFVPDPNDASKIRVLHRTEGVPDTSPPPHTSIIVPAVPNRISGITVGRRAVRAYLTNADGTITGSSAKSVVKYVAIQPGLNFVEFTIRRDSTTTSTSTP